MLFGPPNRFSQPNLLGTFNWMVYFKHPIIPFPFMIRIYYLLEKYKLTDAVLIALIVVLKVLYKMYKV